MNDNITTAREANAIEIIGQRIALQRQGANYAGCCPFHSDRTPSLIVFPDSNRFHCFGCGESGDAIHFVQLFDGVNFGEAIARIAGKETSIWRPPQVSKVSKVSKASRDSTANSAYAREIWTKAEEVPGTIADHYLRSRAIDATQLHHKPTIRYTRLKHKDTGQFHPALISRIDDANHDLVAIQRTFLTEDGRKLPGVNAKLSLGPLTGNATKLSSLSDEIVLCEGLEDGMSLQLALPRTSVWVAAGTSNLSTMKLPQKCRRVTIAADNDDAGTTAANDAAEIYRRQGFETYVIRPDQQYKDFNGQQKASAA